MISHCISKCDLTRVGSLFCQESNLKMPNILKYALGEGLKKMANYPHFVDKRLTPTPPYPRRPELIVFTPSNFFSAFAAPPPPLGPYPQLAILIIVF